MGVTMLQLPASYSKEGARGALHRMGLRGDSTKMEKGKQAFPSPGESDSPSNPLFFLGDMLTCHLIIILILKKYIYVFER